MTTGVQTKRGLQCRALSSKETSAPRIAALTLLAKAGSRHICQMALWFPLLCQGSTTEDEGPPPTVWTTQFCRGCAYFLRHSDFLGALGSLKGAIRASAGWDFRAITALNISQPNHPTTMPRFSPPPCPTSACPSNILLKAPCPHEPDLHNCAQQVALFWRLAGSIVFYCKE